MLYLTTVGYVQYLLTYLLRRSFRQFRQLFGARSYRQHAINTEGESKESSSESAGTLAHHEIPVVEAIHYCPRHVTSQRQCV
jgi:hypothetical protein